MKSKSISTTQALAVALLLQGVANAAESPVVAPAATDTALASQPTSVQAHVAQTLRLAQAAEPAAQSSQNIQLAQAAPVSEATGADNPGALSEVTVTGSRIAARPGYESPTPLTVLSADDLLGNSANSDVKNSLQELPVFAGGGYNTTYGAGVPSFNAAGVSSIEMRNLGITRTLVLLDGMRAVGSLANGLVDVDTFPQQLVKQVEVVTGGASAVYGSDAVAGVTNFILDHDFTGVKGEISGGETTYGDGSNTKLSLAGGFKFAGGKGHVLLSGETTNQDGVTGAARDWNWTMHEYILNPAYAAGNGAPQYITSDNAFLATATKGGLISYGPLTGIAFGQGGTPYKFNYGTHVAGDVFMAGGDAASTLTSDAYSLLPDQKRRNLFGRVSYDVTDHFNAYLQVSHATNWTSGISFPHYLVATSPTAGLLVSSGNPFIPASVQAQMTALGVTSFRVGTMAYDLPWVTAETDRTTNRYVAGGTGDFDLFATNWKWNAYANIGRTTGNTYTHNARNVAKFNLALDAVRDPATGAIVCRSTLTSPNNGCVPFDAMGTGVNSAAALNYVLGTPNDYQSVSEDDYGATVTGDLFEGWAGPISLALSAEHRKESAVDEPDPISLVAGWHSGNHQPLNASTQVSEAAVETLIPLLKDKPFAEMWDLSAAYRYTDYKISGKANTWKFGTTWTPVSGVRFRGTVSRDIRAPNISDLFQAQNYGLGAVINPWSNQSNVINRVQLGSPDLVPEIATTKTFGVVLQPTFAPGLGFSIDYYDTLVKDAIALVSANSVPGLCFQNMQKGSAELCDWITWDPNAGAPFSATGVIAQARQGNFNMASQKVRGVDVEASYRFSLDQLAEDLPGAVQLRVIGTRNLENFTDDGNPNTLDFETVGAGVSKNRVNSSAAYTVGQFTGGVTMRYFSGTVSSNSSIECQTNCPVSNTVQTTFDDIHTKPSAKYYDVSLSWSLDSLLGHETDSRLFLNVKNVFDKDPPLIPNIGGSGSLPYIYSRTGASNAQYDILGRTFRAGINFKF
ncbi:MAG: TonB-dependent receptor [Gammaproteobacteria bacterium]